jgi:O-antigen ligase
MLVVAGFVFLPTDQLIGRFANLAKTEEISADTRAEVWRETVKLVAAYPLTGVGLGGYESAFTKYRTVAPLQTVDYAHNDYLQAMAELGLPGFGLALGFAGLMMARALGAAAATPGLSERYLGIACAASLASLMLHSLVDFNLYIPANAMVAAWVCGLADGLELRNGTIASPRVQGSAVYLEAQ